jgi:hypothetical protein
VSSGRTQIHRSRNRGDSDLLGSIHGGVVFCYSSTHKGTAAGGGRGANPVLEREGKEKVIKIHDFKQWGMKLPDGTDIECDTMEELLEFLTLTLAEGQTASITRHSREGWLKNKKAAMEFNQKQSEEALKLVEKAH